MDKAIVFIIVACALLFIVRRMYGNMKRGQCDCGCGCGKKCKSKIKEIS